MSRQGATPSRAGIRDVATAAGVSVTTVSHALSGVRAVKAETRDRVLREAERLGYLPDPRARGLRNRRSYIIGLLGDRIVTSPHASRMVLGAQSAAAEQDCVVVALDSGDDPDVEADQVRSLLNQRVDGVVYARMYHQQVVLPEALRGTPVVLLDARSTGPDHSSIVPDEHAIATTGVGHLLERGHRRIAYATTTDHAPAVDARERGYREALDRAGLPVDESLLAASTADAAGGRTAGQRLLDRPDRPTAIFCFNDQIAMGVYQTAAALGLSIPHDLSVVGVDNLLLVAEALDPGLTTVELPHRAMGRWAVEQLLSLIEAPADYAVDHVELRCELVHRGSVAPVSGGQEVPG